MSLLKNGWVVKNAVNRDVERQHLNKILAEIRAAMTAVEDTAGGGGASDIQAVVGRMVDGNTETGISVDYDAARRVLNFVVSNFIIRLSGDVTGQGEVNGLQSVTIPVTIDPSKVGIGDAPVDGQAYWRRDGSWQATGTALDQLQYFQGGGFAVLDFGGEWHARIIDGADGQVEVENGNGVDGDTIISLADVGNTGTGRLLAIEVDSKGRVVGTINMSAPLKSQTGVPLTDQLGRLMYPNNWGIDWAYLQDKPTTLAGYGITDAAPATSPVFPVTALPSVTPAARQIFVTGASGAPGAMIPAYTDGIKWRRYSDDSELP